MKYAMRSSVYVEAIKADVWVSDDGDRSILSFTAPLMPNELSLHIPPSVAQATAAAFNKAMAEHEELRSVEAAE